MIDKVAIFIIRFIICLVILAAVSALGCAASPFGSPSESIYGPYGSAYRVGYTYRSNIPVAPAHVGFHRPPVHWHESVFSFRIVNKTQRLHARCVIDGQEHTRTVRGQVLRAYIATEQGIQTVALIPPGETSYLMFDGELSNMRCELYGGPVQVAPDGSYIFRKIAERWIRDFTPDQFPDRMYRIDDSEFLNYDRV